MLKTSLLLFLTFFSTLASGTKENQHDLISNPTGDTNLPAFLPLGRTFPLRYKAWCLGFSATVEPSVNVELAYQSKQYRPMSQVGAHYSYTHDLSEGLADLPGQDVAHEWGGAFMATTSRFKAGVTLGFGAFHISAELGGRIDMHSYTFSDNSDTNGLTTKAVYEFAKSKLRNDKSLMKQLSSQATGLINLLRAQSKGTSATLASKEDIEDGLREAIAELGPMLINTVQMAKRKINQEIRVPLMNAMQKGLKSPGVKAMKPRLSAGNTPKSLARRFGSAVSKTDEDNILKTYEKRLRYLVTRLVYDITYQIATKVFFGRDDLDMFAVYGTNPSGEARKRHSITTKLHEFMECKKEPCEPQRCFKAPHWFQPTESSKKRFGRLLCVLFQNDPESEFGDVLLQAKEKELGEEDICRTDLALESSETCQNSDRSCVWAAKIKGIGKTCCHQHNVMRIRRPENKEVEIFACAVSTKSFNTYTSKRNGRIASLKDNAAIYRLYYPNVYRDNVPHCPDPSNSMTLLQHNIWSDCVVKVPLSIANLFPEIFKAFSHFFDEMDTIISADVVPRLEMTKEQIRWCQDDDSCNKAVLDSSLTGPQTILAMVDSFHDHISHGEFGILREERVMRESHGADSFNPKKGRELWALSRMLNTGAKLTFEPEDMARVVETAAETVAFASTCPSCDDGILPECLSLFVSTPKVGFQTCNIKNSCVGDYMLRHRCESSLEALSSAKPSEKYRMLLGTKRNELGPGSPDTWTCTMRSKDSLSVHLTGTKVFKSLNAFDSCAEIIDEIAPGGPLNFPREMCPKCSGSRAPECLRVKAITSWKTRSTKCVVSNECKSQSFEIDHRCRGGTNSIKSRKKANKQGIFERFPLKPKMSWVCYDYSNDSTENACISLIDKVRPSMDSTVLPNLNGKSSNAQVLKCLELKLSPDKKNCVVSRKRVKGKHTAYCEENEFPCKLPEEMPNSKTGMCPSGVRASCVPLKNFQCKKYLNIIKEYALGSKTYLKMKNILGVKPNGKIDESKSLTTDSKFEEYQMVWGLLNSNRIRQECMKRQKLCEAASSQKPCACPKDICKNEPKGINPFKLRFSKNTCNCVVQDDEMPASIHVNNQDADYGVVDDCFDEATGQPRNFVVTHYCKMPRTSNALFPIDPLANSRFYQCPLTEANKLYTQGSKSILGGDDEQLLKACSNTIETIEEGNILGSSVPNCLKLTLRKSSVTRKYICQLRNHCVGTSFVITHTCNSATSVVRLGASNSFSDEDEFTCLVSDTRSRNAWGSCVEIFRDFKVSEGDEEDRIISNEMLNSRTGTKRQKPWIVVPNRIVGPIVTLQGILDTTSTSIKTIPKIDKKRVIPRYGGTMSCTVPSFDYAIRQVKQICENQGCEYDTKTKNCVRSSSLTEENRFEPIRWADQLGRNGAAPKKLTDREILESKSRNVPRFAKNSRRGPLPFTRLGPLDSAQSIYYSRLDGELEDCVHVDATNFKFALTDGRVKAFSCVVRNLCEDAVVVSHSCASNGGELVRTPLNGWNTFHSNRKSSMTCDEMTVSPQVLSNNLPNAHIMEQLKDYCLRTRISSVRFGTLLNDPVLFPAIHNIVPKCLSLRVTEQQCLFENECGNDLIIRHRCKLEATTLSIPVDAHGLEGDESVIPQQATFGCSREHDQNNHWYQWEDCAGLLIGVTPYSSSDREKVEKAWATPPETFECETFLGLLDKYGVSQKARTDTAKLAKLRNEREGEGTVDMVNIESFMDDYTYQDHMWKRLGYSKTNDMAYTRSLLNDAHHFVECSKRKLMCNEYDLDKESHCSGCETRSDICRYFPSLWDDDVLEYTYDHEVAGCPEEDVAKNKEGECVRECVRCMEIGWCVRGKHVSNLDAEHPRFARCKNCTCEGHVVNPMTKSKAPWRVCKCEVKNDDFNFYESRQPYVPVYRTKIPQAIQKTPERMSFRVLENIDDTMKTMNEAMEDQNEAVAALTKPSLCGSKTVTPSNPNRRCASLRIEASVKFTVGWGSSSNSITTFCDALEKAHGSIAISSAVNFLFIGSVDPRFRQENTENIIWDVVLGGDIVEAQKEKNMNAVTKLLPELALSFKPPLIPVLIELIHRKTQWFKTGREMAAGQYLIVTMDVPGMEICPCLIPPREWLEKIGELIGKLLQFLGPILKTIGKAIAKEVLKWLKEGDWDWLRDAAGWIAENIGAAYRSKKMVRLEITISKSGISVGLGCLRNKILTITTPYGTFEGQYANGGLFDLGNFINQVFYASFDVFSTATSMIKNSKEMNGKCFRSKVSSLFSKLGTRVKASQVLPYIQHTFIQNVFEAAKNDATDLLDTSYDDALAAVDVTQMEMETLGGDMMTDMTDISPDDITDVDIEDVMDSAAVHGAMEHIEENSETIVHETGTGFVHGVAESVLEGDSMTDAVGNGVAEGVSDGLTSTGELAVVGAVNEVLEESGVAPFAEALTESTAELRSAVMASFDTVVGQIDLDNDMYVNELEVIVSNAILGESDAWEDELESLRNKFVQDLGTQTAEALVSEESLDSMGSLGDAILDTEIPIPSDYIDSEYLDRFESSLDTLHDALEKIAGRTVEGLVDNVNFVIGAVALNTAVNAAVSAAVKNGKANPFFYSAEKETISEDEELDQSTDIVSAQRTKSPRNRGSLRKRRDASGGELSPESFRFLLLQDGNVGSACTGTEVSDYDTNCCCLESSKKVISCQHYVDEFSKKFILEYSNRNPGEESATVQGVLEAHLSAVRANSTNVCQVDSTNRICVAAISAVKMAGKKNLDSKGYCEDFLEDEGEDDREEEGDREEAPVKQKREWGYFAFKCDGLFSSYGTYLVTHNPFKETLVLCKKGSSASSECRTIPIPLSSVLQADKSKNSKVKNKINVYDSSTNKKCYLRHDDEASCKKFQKKGESSCVTESVFKEFGTAVGVIW